MDHLETSESTVIEVKKSPHLELNYYPGIGAAKNTLKYIFESIYLDDQMVKEKIEIDSLSTEKFEIMKD